MSAYRRRAAGAGTRAAGGAASPGEYAGLEAASLALLRDLQLAFRKRAQLMQPLAFFALVTMLFPLAISPELSQLRAWRPGCCGWRRCSPRCWRSSSCFATTRTTARSSSTRSRASRSTWLMFAKTAAHWLLTGLPLALMAPFAAPVARRARPRRLPGIVACGDCVGSVALSLIGSIGAALTLGIKRSGALLSLLTLPLSLPVLIFGARATAAGDRRRAAAAPLELLAALAVLAHHARAAGGGRGRAHQSGVAEGAA